MTEETFTRTKDPDELDPNVAPGDAEAFREGHVWVKLCRINGLNADMVVRTEHTADAYSWVIDRSRTEPPSPEA